MAFRIRKSNQTSTYEKTFIPDETDETDETFESEQKTDESKKSSKKTKNHVDVQRKVKSDGFSVKSNRSAECDLY